MELLEKQEKPDAQECQVKGCDELMDGTLTFTITSISRFGKVKQELIEKEICIDHSLLIADIASAGYDEQKKLSAYKKIEWKN